MMKNCTVDSKWQNVYIRRQEIYLV